MYNNAKSCGKPSGYQHLYLSKCSRSLDAGVMNVCNNWSWQNVVGVLNKLFSVLIGRYALWCSVSVMHQVWNIVPFCSSHSIYNETFDFCLCIVIFMLQITKLWCNGNANRKTQKVICNYCSATQVNSPVFVPVLSALK